MPCVFIDENLGPWPIYFVNTPPIPKTLLGTRPIKYCFMREATVTSLDDLWRRVEEGEEGTLCKCKVKELLLTNSLEYLSDLQ